MKKFFKTGIIALLSGTLLVAATGCNMSNLGKGALIGGAGGGAVGAGVGALIGKGKGAAIGAAVGTAVGAGAGALIGKKMDDQQKKLKEQLANATVEQTTDMNGLQGIKVTFEGGILFPTNGTTLSANAKNELSKFASSLISNPDTDVHIYGFTDNTGKMAANEKVATGRALSVLDFLKSKGVAANRLSSEGIPMADYVASNETAEGRAQNRRVEIYITANENMIKKAENGTL